MSKNGYGRLTGDFPELFLSGWEFLKRSSRKPLFQNDNHLVNIGTCSEKLLEDLQDEDTPRDKAFESDISKAWDGVFSSMEAGIAKKCCYHPGRRNAVCEVDTLEPEGLCTVLNEFHLRKLIKSIIA